MKKTSILISVLFSSFLLASCGGGSSGGSASTPVPTAPSNLTATESNSDAINLSWDSVAGASYRIYQSTSPIANNLSGHISYDVTETSTKITGLTNNTSYYFVVTALVNGKESPASNEVNRLPEFLQPSTPTSLRATPSNGAVNLSWIGSTGASYKVYQSTATIIANDLSSYTSYNVTESAIEIPGLMNGTTYYFVIRAMIGDKKSGVSGEVSGLPEEHLIAPPTNLRVTASSGTVNLNWKGRDGATYKVHQATSSFGDDVADYENLAVGYSSIHITAISTKITGLTNGETYYFVVTALIDDKESGASNEVIGNPDFPIPLAPTSLTVTSASSGTVNLSWNSVAGATYKVYQSTASIGDDLSGHISYDVAETSTKITGLTNNTSYYFVVTALVNGKESSASNEVNGLPEFPLPSTPTNLIVTGVSSGTMNLSWTGSAGVHYYKVYQSTGSIDDDLLSSYQSYEATTNSREITGLTNNTIYYFVVRAVIDDKESGISNEASGFPDFPQPSTPTNLSATPSSGTVNLSWNSVAGATYKVYQSTGTIIVADLSSYTSYNVTVSSKEIPGLANGTTYYFVVIAVIGDKESGISDEVSGTPEENLIAPPTNLMMTAGNGTVALNWNSVAGATYRVHQSTSSFVGVADYENLEGYKLIEVTTTSTEITGLINGKTYYFVVTAVIGDKESGASNEVNVLPDFPIPETPTGLVVTNASGTVNLSWTGSDGATYKVYQSTASIGDDLSVYQSYDVSETSTKITGLTNGTSYYFVVTAFKDGKESPASNEVSGFPDFPQPSTPTNLRATPSSGTINLSWMGSDGAHYYKVYQSTGSIGDDLLSSYQSYEATTNSREITGLTNNTTYYFVVTAVIGDKESEASNEASGLPEFPQPTTPTNLTVMNASGTVNLSWTGSDGATYKVYQSTASIGDDLSGHIFYDVAETSTKITGLMNGETYYFVVTALANGKESPASEWVSALPDFPIPSAPTSLTVTSESSGTVNLSWNSVAGASYTVYRSIGPIGDDLSTSQPYETTKNSIAITGLTNNMSYYFVVTALANGKVSPASNEVSGLPEFPVPSTPTNLTASASSGTVNLSWTGSEGVHYYKVYQSTGTIIADDLSSYSSQNVTQSSIEITGLTNNTTYYFVVMAVIGDKESGISDEVSGLPEFPQPSTPTNLTATPSSGTVNLSWTGSAGAHYYKVYQSTRTIIAADLSSYTSYNVTANTIEIPGLANYTSYYFVVIAVIGDKESGISDEVSGLPEEDLIAPPTNLEVTDSSGAVSLNWTGREGATYKVHQAEATFGVVAIADYGTSTNYRSYDITETSTKITGLVNGRSYYFVVTALVGSKESGASNEVTGNPDFPIPSTPTNLEVTASSGTVNLSWDSVAGASYKVYQSTASIANDLSAYISYDVIETSREISGLTNGTLYYFVVTALENGKESPASDEIIGLPDFPIPASPTGLVVTSASSGTVNLSWNSVVGATYKVYQSTASIANDLSDLSGSIFRDATTNSIEITGLRNGRSYYFVVTALENGKESPVSNEVDGLPDFPIPATPTGLVVTSVSSGTVNLRWNSVAGVSHKVYQSAGRPFSDDLSSYTSYNVTARSKRITDLGNGTRYYFVVTALANGKESPASNEVNEFPDFPIPSTPTGLEVTNVSSVTVSLRWNSVAGATYRVYYQSTPINDDVALSFFDDATTSSIEIEGLTIGTRYYFVVTALVNGKESPVSNEVNGIPDFPIPATPTGLVVTSINGGIVNLSWGSVVGASYKVYQSSESIGDDLAGHISYDVAETSTEITGLTNGTRYYFVVTALANGKESPASKEVDALPDFPIPPAPTNLRARASSGTVNLSWDSGVAGATYKVHQATETFESMAQLNYEVLSDYQSTEVNTSLIRITGLMNDISYYFVVTAIRNGKESVASNEVSSTPTSSPNPLIYPLVIGTGEILTVSHHPDADTNKFVAGTGVGLVLLYSYTFTGKITLEQRFTGHTENVNSVAFSPDGSKIVSGSGDDTIRLWDVNIGGQIGSPFTGHTDDVNSVAFSTDGSKIVSGGDDTIRLWDVSDVNVVSQISSLTGYAALENSVAFSPTDGSKIVSGNVSGLKDRGIRLWDVSDVNAVSYTSLIGHEGRVYSVAFSPDGSKIVSGGGSGDSTIRLWDVNAGSQIGSPLTVPTSSIALIIYSVAFSLDGSKIVSGDSDDKIRLWDVSDVNAVTQIDSNFSGSGHTDGVRSVVFNPDGSKIISGSEDGTVRLWNINKGNQIGRHTGDVHSVAFSADGRKIVSASYDRTIRLWDVTTGKQIGNNLNIEGDGNWVNSVAFSPDGSKIVSGSEDNTVILWDISDVNAVSHTSLTGHTGSVNSVAFSPDGSKIVSGSVDNTIILWDVSDVNAVSHTSLTGHTYRVNSVAFSPDGSKIVSGSGDHTIILWNANTGSQDRTLGGHTQGVNSVAFSPDGSKIVSGSRDNTIRLWDVSTGLRIGNDLTGHTGSVNSVAFSPDGSKIVSGSRDNTIRLWNVSTGGLIENFSDGGITHNGVVESVAFSPDGSIIVSGGDAKTIRLWHVHRESQIGSNLGAHNHTDDVNSVAFSPDGSKFVSGSADNTIRLWDINTGLQIGNNLTGHTDNVNSVAFSPDGSKIVSGSADKTIRLWDVSTGNQIGSDFEGHTGQVLSVAFSSDGSTIVSGSADNTIRLWDINTGLQIGDPLRGHTNWVRSVAFSPDGSTIVSGGDDNTIRLWDANTGLQIGSLLTVHENLVYSVAFSPDGSTIVSSGNSRRVDDDDKIKLWDVSDVNAVSQIGSDFVGHTNRVSFVAFSSDGSKIVSSSFDSTIRLWDVSDVNAVSQIGSPLRGHTNWVNSVAFSPDGSKVVSASADHSIRVWLVNE